jgi:hypothetical protein
MRKLSEVAVMANIVQCQSKVVEFSSAAYTLLML